LNITFTDLEENYVLELENAVLHQHKGSPSPNADASIDITHALFVQMLTGGAGASDILFSDDISIEGSKLGLVKFFALLDTPEASFNIVTP
jgi:alkyl sulfatase BDS1-like metallo-beta-lactamase superfamily hydrolase